MTNEDKISYATAGYTHLVCYEKKTHFGWVPASFPTTEDAVEMYRGAMTNDPKVRNLKIKEL